MRDEAQFSMACGATVHADLADEAWVMYRMAEDPRNKGWDPCEITPYRLLPLLSYTVDDSARSSIKAIPAVTIMPCGGLDTHRKSESGVGYNEESIHAWAWRCSTVGQARYKGIFVHGVGGVWGRIASRVQRSPVPRYRCFI